MEKKEKEYRYYGVIVKSNTVVSIIELEDDSTMDEYSHFIYAIMKHNCWGDLKAFEISIFDVETKEELKNDFWEIESINYYSREATILLKDVYRNDLEVELKDLNYHSYYHGWNRIVSTILDIINHYSCRLEYELLNDESIKWNEKPVSMEEFIKIKNNIKNYVSKYRQLEQNTALWTGVSATHKLELKNRYDDAIAGLLNVEIIIESNKDE